MPIISDSIQVDSFVSYLLDIKPFHTKLQDAIIEYQINDNINVGISASHSTAIDLSSLWRYSFVSDGIKKQYRIPAAVFPRYSKDFHQSSRTGVTDEIPGMPGAYAVPNNAALEVFVNGFEQQLNVNYTVNSDRTIVQFKPGFVPALNDSIELNWAVLDRVFIGVQNSDGSISWQQYTLSYFSENSAYDIIPFDLQIFDDDTNGTFFNGETTTNSALLSPIGYVEVVQDPNQGNQLYYVFNFNTPYSLNTTFWIQVEQREAYNGWTQTSITESIKFYDTLKANDIVNVKIVDFNNYNDETGFYDINDFDTWIYDDPYVSHDFSINISANKTGTYDLEAYDTAPDGLDSIYSNQIMGYYQWAAITENTLPDSPSASIAESIGITFSEYDYYDSENYDDPLFGYDGTSIINSIVSPDSTGTVYMNLPAVQVTIFTKYTWNPQVFVYVNNQLYFPQSVTYPVLGVVIINFAEQVKAVIRLI